MHFTSNIIAAILAYCAIRVAALPVPQLAGVGQGCDSVFTQTDNAVGYGIEYAEENTAGNLKSALSKAHSRRQLAGVGQGCNSVFTEFDNGLGYGIEDAEENTAKLISGKGGSGGSTGGSAPPPPPPPPPHHKDRRQLDKISNGFQAITNAAGAGSSTSSLTTELDNLDGTGTSGSAQIGAAIGQGEVDILEGIGKAIPKRQLDKISNGFQAIANAANVGSLTSGLTTELDNLDGAGTSGSAQVGAAIGQAEVDILEGVGKAVP
ncbi:unnamed protein product [Zymoseptoria tritici ST99CH_1E4]|uniref:Uncharacterized protein n=1 Tax=Zymoseptoria tritici ST99CH_1E4 TaxID=1276532 RepID=A0A2H1GYP8_ZYMTR|nr:unnamed protein product [Zymoseptoria tritici ST99CH_1E4]